MKPWADKVEAKLAEQGAALRAVQDEVTYPKRSASEDRKLDGKVERLRPEWYSYAIGTLVSGRPVAARGAITLATYSAGGIAAATLGLPGVPGRVDVQVPPFRIGGDDWTFVWDETNDKLLMYDAAGDEVLAAVDVSAVADWPVTVWGASTPRLPFHRAAGGEQVLEVRVEAANDVDHDPDATDYWVIEVRRRNAAKPNGERIGDRLDMSATRLRSDEEVVLYDDAPFDLADEDVLDLVATETGSAPAIEGLVVWVKRTRRV